MQKVDIRGWQRDEEFFPFPEGARDKYALIAPDLIHDTRIVPGHRYLMKFSNPRYAGQFWSEIIAKTVATHMGVDVPDCFYAEDAETGQPGSLISWFYGAKIESAVVFPIPALLETGEADVPTPPELPSTHSLYVPGSSYMVRHIPGYDLKTGRQHNLKTIGLLFASFRQKFYIDFWPSWGRILLFDAVIGNTDRHQDNWGILWRATSDGVKVPKFAPAFDNGTSLLHEIMNERINKFDEKGALQRYVLRGRHHIRYERDDAKPAPHLELIKAVATRRPELISIFLNALNIDVEELRSNLFDFVQFECGVPLSIERAQLILAAIDLRIKIIREDLLGML